MTQNSLPSMARAVAILNLVFGAFGLLGTPCFGLMFLDTSSTNPAVQAVRSDPFLFAWTLGSIAFGAFLSLVQIVASAALLNLQAWSRWALLGESSCHILSTLLGFLVEGLVMAPRVLEITRRMGDPGEKYGALGGMVGGAFGSLFALVLPIITIVVLLKPETVAALQVRKYTAPNYPPAPR
jgi:hypothetical protein